MLGEHASRPPDGVTLDNWQVAPQLHWSFQHIEDLFPTAIISRGTGPVAELPPGFSAVGDLAVPQPDGSILTVAETMAATNTDGWMVCQHGRVIAEHYPHGMDPDTRHLLMSVSKSLVGVVAGALVAGGALDPLRPLTAYVPELETSGYAGAVVRHLLDMRSGIHFSEEYLDPQAEVRVLEQAIGWAPRQHPLVPRTMYDYPPDPEAEGSARRTLRVPQLRDRRPRLGLRGRLGTPDARAHVAGPLVAARGRERRDDRRGLRRLRHVRRGHLRHAPRPGPIRQHAGPRRARRSPATRFSPRPGSRTPSGATPTHATPSQQAPPRR